MSEDQHTPGPWTWSGEVGDDCSLISPNEVVIAYYDYEGMSLHGPNSASNARLIAAAPAMLAALKTIVEDFAQRVQALDRKTDIAEVEAIRKGLAAIDLAEALKPAAS